MENGETFPINLYSGLVYLVVPAQLEKTLLLFKAAYDLFVKFFV